VRYKRFPIPAWKVRADHVGPPGSRAPDLRNGLGSIAFLSDAALPELVSGLVVPGLDGHLNVGRRQHGNDSSQRAFLERPSQPSTCRRAFGLQTGKTVAQVAKSLGTAMDGDAR